MRLLNVILILTLLLPIRGAFTQTQKLREIGPSFCSMRLTGLTSREDATQSRKVKTLAAEDYVLRWADEILGAIGLPRKFEIEQRPDEFGAEAPTIKLREPRLILYDPKFFQDLKKVTKSDWAVKGILAHEIAHHMLDHTLHPEERGPKIELEADERAGYWLGKLGAPLKEVQQGFYEISSELDIPGREHPLRSERLAAVERGWRAATSSGSATPPRVSATLTPIIALPRGVDPTRLAVHNFTTATVDANGKVSKFAGKPTQQYNEDLGGGVLLEMVPVQGFSGGDFWIGKYEVTQAQWQALMRNSTSKFKGARLPVERVTWDEMKEFCRRLNAKLRLSGENVYRLPKEAEWEYAARAGTRTKFAFGETISPEIVNYDGNYPVGSAAKGIFRKQTVEVGSLGVANGWGIYDMHGNVAEWCEDLKYSSDGTGRVFRGGSWVEDAAEGMSAKSHFLNDQRSFNLGFRLLRK